MAIFNVAEVEKYVLGNDKNEWILLQIILWFKKIIIYLYIFGKNKFDLPGYAK